MARRAAASSQGTRTVSHLGIKNDEAMLVDLAMRLARYTEGRRAVHVRLSGLGAHYRREHHVRIALNCFDPLIKKFHGEIFLLRNEDIVFVCKGASVVEIDDVVLRLRFLFSEDPLAWAEDERESRAFCIWYDLETGYDDFRAMALNAKSVGNQ